MKTIRDLNLNEIFCSIKSSIERNQPLWSPMLRTYSSNAHVCLSVCLSVCMHVCKIFLISETKLQKRSFQGDWPKPIKKFHWKHRCISPFIFRFLLDLPRLTVQSKHFSKTLSNIEQNYSNSELNRTKKYLFKVKNGNTRPGCEIC